MCNTKEDCNLTAKMEDVIPITLSETTKAQLNDLERAISKYKQGTVTMHDLLKAVEMLYFPLKAECEAQLKQFDRLEKLRLKAKQNASAFDVPLHFVSSLQQAEKWRKALKGKFTFEPTTITYKERPLIAYNVSNTEGVAYMLAVSQKEYQNRVQDIKDTQAECEAYITKLEELLNLSLNNLKNREKQLRSNLSDSKDKQSKRMGGLA